jgi:Trypsin
MLKIRALAMGVAGAALLGSACSAGVDEPTEHLQEGVVRAAAEGGRNEVVMLYVSVVNGTTGAVSRRTCSGAYFAPRVVATAAHCLDGNPEQAEQVAQVLVYYGDDFATDSAAELTPFGIAFSLPKPGQPSHFSEADSFEVHPQWDRSQIFPDLGVVYLDRKLPFDPLPLGRFRLDSRWQGKTATISGWGADEATGPSTATGARVQRTGTSKIVGSPTAADYHPEDPNPGLLSATNRTKILKINGQAPNANACFGDSGSPLLVRQWGQTYIAGIEYFGGLYCEDYSLYTRLDPFLPFFDEAYRKGGQAPLVPTLDCVAANADGTFTAFFGHKNDNGVAVTVPLGAKNALARDPQGYRTTRFEPGTHHFTFGADFSVNRTLVYALSPENSPTTVLRVDKSSKRCGAADQPQALCGQACRAQLASGCTGLQDYGTCIEGCTGFYGAFGDPGECKAFIDQWNGCVATQAPGPDNWICFDESGPGAGDGFADAPNCLPYLDSFFECALGG